MSKDLDRIKKALKHSTTLPQGAVTGSWLMGSAADGHVHGPHCNHGHAHDEECDHDHHHHHEHKDDGSCCGGH